MAFIHFGLVKKSCLGIDIGSSIVKIVELSRAGERLRLEAYGGITAESVYEKPFRTLEKNTLLFQSMDIAKAIGGIIEEAKMFTRRAVFSIPDFSTFYTTFDLPAMSLPELSQAVRFRVRQQIPVPLNEVSLDWSVIEGEPSEKSNSTLKILLVAVPNEVINQYQEISRLAKLDLFALEAEVFGFLRGVNPDRNKVVVLVDIGAQSTTCTIVDKGVLKQSRSFEPANNEITEVVSKGFQIDFREAEKLKEKYGLLFMEEPRGKDVSEVISAIVDAIIMEVQKTIQNFYITETKSPNLVVIGGGMALMPGLKEYFAKRLEKQVEITNPFFSSKIFCPPIMEKTLKILAPSYAIAVGTAMRGLEEK